MNIASHRKAFVEGHPEGEAAVACKNGMYRVKGKLQVRARPFRLRSPVSRLSHHQYSFTCSYTFRPFIALTVGFQRAIVGHLPSQGEIQGR